MSGHRLIIAPGATLEQVEQNEDKSGVRTIYTFSGSKVNCEAQRIQSRTAGAKTINLRSRGDGNYELICTHPFDAEDGGNGDAEVPTDTHELESVSAQQDVFLNPKLIAALTETNRHILKQHVDKFKRGDFDTVDAADDAVWNAAEAPQQAATQNYFRLIAFTGVEHWMFYRSVYSRTITSATPRQVQASFQGTQKIWTTAQLLAQEGLPNDWWFQLPTDYKWHKSEPTVGTQIGKGSKTQITYKYIASSEVSELLYDNY